MGNFNRDDRRGGGRGFGGRDFGRRDFRGGGFDRRGGDRQMFKAICSNCGKECEVPFRPTGSKPVFCSECFEKRSREAGHDNFQDRGPRRPSFENRSPEQPQYREQFIALNAKLDRILAMLTPSAPVKISQEEKVGKKAVEEKPKKKAEKTEKKKKVTKKQTSEETDSLV